MLKKVVCRKCHDESRWRKWDESPAKDRMWRMGRVACVAEVDRMHRNVWVKVDGGPPESCPYLLEQIL